MQTARPARIGILTAYPREAFQSTVEVIGQHGHVADVIEWKRVIPSLIDNSFAFEYDGPLKAGGLREYDLLFNHFCGFRVSYYYFAFKAVCTTPIVNDWDGVVLASDKLKTLITARNLGIRVPDTVLLKQRGLRCRHHARRELPSLPDDHEGSGVRQRRKGLSGQQPEGCMGAMDRK